MERVSKWELLWVTTDETLTLIKHVSLLLIKLSLIFEYLKKAQKIQVTASMQAAGRIANLSRLSFCNHLFIDLTQYQIRRMIKLQKSCVSLARRQKSSMEDIVSLKWLLIPKRIDYTILKLTFKRILNQRMPSYLQMGKGNNKRKLKSTETLKLILMNDPMWATVHIFSST